MVGRLARCQRQGALAAGTPLVEVRRQTHPDPIFSFISVPREWLNRQSKAVVGLAFVGVVDVA